MERLAELSNLETLYDVSVILSAHAHQGSIEQWFDHA